MEAKLKYQGDVAVISIEGSLKIERTQPFKEVCLSQFLAQKVVFNMAQTSFVGSTGLQAFIATLRGFDQRGPHGIKLVGMKPEFVRLLGSMQFSKVEFHESEETAISSFNSVSGSGSIPG